MNWISVDSREQISLLWAKLGLAIVLTAPSNLTAVANDETAPHSITALVLQGGEAESILVDGVLSEPGWRRAVPATSFRQHEPFEGAPATERTEVRILYDSEILYVGVLAFDRNPDRLIARILERDKIIEPDTEGKPSFAGDDAVAILLDPFHDHRNAFVFATNPNAAEFDALLTDEGREFNRDWRAVWQVAAQRLPNGWSAEFAIPLRTLRYPSHTGDRPWGFNVARVIRHKNEEVLWSAWSRDNEGFARVSRAGHLYGMNNVPRQKLNLEVKPFGLSRISNTLNNASHFETDRQIEGGLDAKWEIRPGLLLDLTLNTDFAQVEVDDEQINLTRFDLFFPEKRDFFLENAGVFDFGDRGLGEPPPFLLFFSRRIGISKDGEIPVIGGARLTGRVGNQTVGLLNVVTDSKHDEPRANFAVARVKRDVGNGSYVGAIVTDRRHRAGRNTAAGVDASFWPSKILNLNTFWAQTMTSGAGGDGQAYRVGIDLNTDRVGFSGHHLMIDPEANAEMGFVTRTDIRRTKGLLRLTGRPKTFGLRAVNVSLLGIYITRVNFEVQDWETGVAVNPEWHSGESVNIFYLKSFARVDAPFDLSKDVTVNPGDYHSWQLGGYFNTSENRFLVFNSQNLLQRFFDGRLISLTNELKLALGRKLAFQLGYARHNVDVPNGRFKTNLVSFRFSYAFSTRLVANALVQYNSLENRFSQNIRLNFVHRAGSDLFFVYNEEHGSDSSAWDLKSRTAVLKVTYLQRL